MLGKFGGAGDISQGTLMFFVHFLEISACLANICCAAVATSYFLYAVGVLVL
jgi:hypothetical protein